MGKGKGGMSLRSCFDIPWNMSCVRHMEGISRKEYQIVIAKRVKSSPAGTPAALRGSPTPTCSGSPPIISMSTSWNMDMMSDEAKLELGLF